MANEIYLQTIFQVKRGKKGRWEEKNPVLRQGEPGFAYDANILKIGDGVTPWIDLPSISGASNLITVETRSELPTVGDISVIYRIVDEKVLCQYSLATGTYENLTAAGGAVSAGLGLKADNGKISIDTDQTFIFNCGGATRNLQK